MTAGQPEGVGQQQGREVCACGHDKGGHDFFDDQGPCDVRRPDGLDYADGCMGFVSAPSPTPPARDSGRDEAREAVARWLVNRTAPQPAGVVCSPWDRSLDEDELGELGSELLSLPELGALLRDKP